MAVSVFVRTTRTPFSVLWTVQEKIPGTSDLILAKRVSQPLRISRVVDPVQEGADPTN